MAFDLKPAPPVVTPVLEELDGGVAFFSDKTQITFPAGTKFEHETGLGGDKVGERVFPPNGGPSFVLVKGATIATVKTAVRRCVEGR